MVAAFDYCLHGKGGAAPSIDTAMHGLVDAAARRPPAPRLRHRDRDRRRRRGADQGDLRRPGRLGAVAPPRLPARPRHRRDQGGATRRRSAASSAATASPPGATPARSARRNSLWIIRHRRGVHRRARQGRAVRRRALDGYDAAAGGRAPRQGRRARADASAALASHGPADGRPLHRRRDVVLDFLARAKHPRLAALGTSLPRPLPAHQGQAAGARPARRRRPSRRSIARLRELHAAYRDGLRRPTTTATRPRTRPAMRGADPAIVLVPGVGMFSFGKDKQTARVAGEFYVNAINVMRGAEGALDVRPDRRGREVPHRVLGARGGQARSGCRSRSRSPTRIALVTGAASRHRQGHRRPGSPPRAPASSSPTSTWRRRRRPRPRSAAPTSPIGVQVDVTDEDAVQADGRRGRARLRRPRPGRQQRRAVAVASRCSRPPTRTGTSSTT